MPNNFERMDAFFNKRASNYDSHMQENVDDFANFYSKIAEPVQATDKEITILDIGCGTGIELADIFKKAPCASIDCLDLSEKMLKKLSEKYSNQKEQINTIIGSYLQKNLGENKYDYIISVMTVHHLPYDKKLKLYKNIHRALKAGGKYIEGDYIVNQKQEKQLLQEYEKKTADLKGARQGEFHIDIPFSLKTQKKLCMQSGFKEFHLLYKKQKAAIYAWKK